eukprot:gene9025-1123_t
MNTFKKGWFTEYNDDWHGQSMSYEVEEVLFHEKSKFQDILIFKSKTYGRMMSLDGIVQSSEKDECAYQEMICHLALCAHKNPKNVVCIGGGDGGVIREVCKHDTVEKVTLCEIDKMVVDSSKKYLPHLSSAFDDERVNFYFDDGCEFIKQRKNEFDIIIVDSSDPIGPAEVLFQKEFYQTCKEGLKEGGILITQAESIWLDLKLISNMKNFIKDIFEHVEYANISIPTYPSGCIGFFVCSNSNSSKKPVRKIDDDKCSYYNEELHETSFVLPKFVEKALE